MEIKTVIEASGNFVDKKYSNVTLNNKKQLQQYLTEQLQYAFERLWHHPIIVLHTKLIGTIDGYEINSTLSQRGLPIYVADIYRRKDGKNIVFNPLRGTDCHISDNYVVMNRDGEQMWPPLSANTHSEVEKFANRAFNTIYKVEKVR